MTTIKGIIPPMCTPLQPDGEIDIDSLHSLVDYLLEQGVHGIFSLGSSGEGPSLTDQQKRVVAATTTEAINGRVPHFVGVIETSTKRAIEAAFAAREAGADYLVVTATSYTPISQAEVLAHFRAIYDAVGLPVIAYDIPVRVSTKLAAATMRTLAEEGIVVGLKDSSGDIHAFRDLLLATRDMDFGVLTGSELLVDVSMRMGGHGSVPGFGNVLPGEYVELYDLIQNDDWEAAVALQNRITACFHEAISQGSPTYSTTARALGGFKAALKHRKVIRHTTCVLPTSSFTPEEEAAVIDVLTQCGFLGRV